MSVSHNDYYEKCLWEMRQVIRMLEFRIQILEEETYGWW